MTGRVNVEKLGSISIDCVAILTESCAFRAWGRVVVYEPAFQREKLAEKSLKLIGKLPTFSLLRKFVPTGALKATKTLESANLWKISTEKRIWKIPQMFTRLVLLQIKKIVILLSVICEINFKNISSSLKIDFKREDSAQTISLEFFNARNIEIHYYKGKIVSTWKPWAVLPFVMLSYRNFRIMWTFLPWKLAKEDSQKIKFKLSLSKDPLNGHENRDFSFRL